MLLEKHHKLKLDITTILKRGTKEKLISMEERDIFNEKIEFATLRVPYSSVEILDTSLIKKVYSEILDIYENIKNKKGIQLREIEDWAIYDPNLFLYTKKRSGDASDLKKIHEWFGLENIIYVNEIDKKTVNKCTIIYYKKEIREQLKKYRIFCHIGTKIKGNMQYHIDELDEFDTIVSISNIKKTELYYGVW